MATNIGRGPEDIPLNQYLGEMAFMDNIYEQGTWLPQQANVSVTVNQNECPWTRIGNIVFASCRITWPSNSNTSNADITGLPFNPDGFINSSCGGPITEGTLTYSGEITASVEASSDIIRFRRNNTVLTNQNMSSQSLRFSVWYHINRNVS
jgi:hypothetical protein